MTNGSESTSDDRIWAALGYPVVIIAIIMLLMEEKKNRPFIKFHAVQAIVVNVVFWVAATILGTVIGLVTFGIGAICVPLFWLILLWPAIEAYNGKYLEIPVITDFIRKQNWV